MRGSPARRLSRHLPGAPLTCIASLRTRSDPQNLAPAQRDPIFAAVADQGGRFEIAYEAHLYVAGKR